MAAVVSTVVPSAMGRAATTVPGQPVFPAAIVGRFAYMTAAVAGLIGVEVVERMLSSSGKRSMIAVTRVVPVVDVAIKSPPAMKPGASADEHVAIKPIGPIVSIGRAVVRSIVEVTVWTYGRGANLDGNLGGR